MQNKWRYFFATIISGVVMVITLSSCNKGTTTGHQPVTDSKKIKLKEVTVQGLPSPYFQYKYDVNGFVTDINHESGFYQYKIEYKNSRISKMINNTLVNKDTLVYHYTGNNVTRIDLQQPGIGKTEEVMLYYDIENKLIEAAWKKNGFADAFKRMLFYYNEQNLMWRCEAYYDLGTVGLEKTNTFDFEQFDDKFNPQSNDLLKESHYLYLPQVQLQKHNPLKLKLSGIVNDFEFDNTYQYNGALPVLKTSLMKQTRGSGAGMERTGRTTYSYF
jgi:hypothetical protein